MLRIRSMMRTPPCGWTYGCAVTGTIIKAQSFVELTKKVRAFRIQKDIPEGDIEADIHAFICRVTHPDVCQDVIPDTTIQVSPKFKFGDVVRFFNAVKDTIKQGGVVPQELASKRAAICSQCPLNRTIAGCYGCQGIATAVTSVLGARKHGYEGRLKQCAACGCYLDAKVWVPTKAQPSSSDYSYPDLCWMVSEQEPASS